LVIGMCVVLTPLSFGNPLPTKAGIQDTQVFRTGVEVVQLDVTALDRKRQPVRNLTAQDFTILENGRPQPIVAFAEQVIAGPGSFADAAVPAIASDVASNELPTGRVVVVILDDATLPFDPLILKNAKQIGQDVIQRLGPADLAAIVFTRDNRATQNFTSDRNRLLGAIEKLSTGFVLPGRSWKPTVPEWHLYYRASLRTLRRVADHLASLRDRRKLVVYVSTGVPLNQGWEDDSHPRDIFLKALRANVNIYPIDPGGFAGFESYLLRKSQLPQAAPQIVQESTRYRDFLQTLANNTGGRAVVNTSDFAAGIDQIFRETSSYYLIGYTPAKPLAAGGYRRLEVRVHRPGISALARSGYFAEVAAPEPAEAASSSDAISGLLPDPGLMMRAALVPLASGDAAKATVAIALAVSQHSGEHPSTARSFEFQTNVFTPDGKLVLSQRRSGTFAAQLRPMHWLEEISGVALAPGRYEVRASAHDLAGSKTGSVFADVLVPDFAHEPLSLSGIAIERPARASVPRPLSPISPTTERTFGRDDTVSAWVQVCRGVATSPAETALVRRILDRSGKEVARVDDRFVIEIVAEARCVEHRRTVPVNQLSSGTYVLMIEANSREHTVSRQLPFTVQ
jgi:VWFA-related protein